MAGTAVKILDRFGLADLDWDCFMDIRDLMNIVPLTLYAERCSLPLF